MLRPLAARLESGPAWIPYAHALGNLQPIKTSSFNRRRRTQGCVVSGSSRGTQGENVHRVSGLEISGGNSLPENQTSQTLLSMSSFCEGAKCGAKHPSLVGGYAL